MLETLAATAGAIPRVLLPDTGGGDDGSPLVQTSSPEIPAPLIEKLAPGGRLIIPLGDRHNQVLTLAQRVGDEVRTSTVADVRFVPLLGEFGFR